MTDLEKLLAGERSFQRTAILLALALITLFSASLSIARAIYSPEQQIAAAAEFVPTPGQPMIFQELAQAGGPRVVRPSGKKIQFDEPATQTVTTLPAVVPPADFGATDGIDPAPGILPAFVPAAAESAGGDPTSTPNLTGPMGPGGAVSFARGPVSPIPEPMTWMMMILGVGMVGGMLRLARQGRGLTQSIAQPA